MSNSHISISLNRLLDESTSFRQEEPWGYLRTVFDASREFLETPNPSLLILVDPSDPGARAAAEELQVTPSVWTTHIAMEATEELSRTRLFDHGIVITNATQPFRQTEAQLLTKFSSDASKWHALCLGADMLEEDESEELDQFVRNTIQRLSTMEVGELWSDSADAQERLATYVTVPRRPTWILARLQRALSEAHIIARKQKLEIDDHWTVVHPASVAIEKQFREASQRLDSLAKRTLEETGNLERRSHRELIERFESVGTELDLHIEHAPMGDLTESTNQLLGTQMRKALEDTDSSIQERIERLVDAFFDEQSQILLSVNVFGKEANLGEDNVLSLGHDTEVALSKREVGGSLTHIRDFMMSVGLASIASHILTMLAWPAGVAAFFLFNRNSAKQKEEQQRQQIRQQAREVLLKIRTQVTGELRKHMDIVADSLRQKFNETITVSRGKLTMTYEHHSEVVARKRLHVEREQTGQDEHRLRELLDRVEQLQDRMSLLTLQQVAKDEQ